MGAPLNLDRVQHERARRFNKLDERITAVVDSLEDAYYGTKQPDDKRAQDGWKHGVSHPWRGFDVMPTIEESKRQFDLLHGAIWHLHAWLVWRANEALSAGEKYDTTFWDAADDGVTPRLARMRAALAEIKTKRPAVWALLKSIATDNGLFDPDTA